MERMKGTKRVGWNRGNSPSSLFDDETGTGKCGLGGEHQGKVLANRNPRAGGKMLEERLTRRGGNSFARESIMDGRMRSLSPFDVCELSKTRAERRKNSAIKPRLVRVLSMNQENTQESTKITQQAVAGLGSVNRTSVPQVQQSEPKISDTFKEIHNLTAQLRTNQTSYGFDDQETLRLEELFSTLVTDPVKPASGPHLPKQGINKSSSQHLKQIEVVSLSSQTHSSSCQLEEPYHMEPLPTKNPATILPNRPAISQFPQSQAMMEEIEVTSSGEPTHNSAETKGGLRRLASMSLQGGSNTHETTEVSEDVTDVDNVPMEEEIPGHKRLYSLEDIDTERLSQVENVERREQEQEREQEIEEEQKPANEIEPIINKEDGMDQEGNLGADVNQIEPTGPTPFLDYKNRPMIKKPNETVALFTKQLSTADKLSQLEKMLQKCKENPAELSKNLVTNRHELLYLFSLSGMLKENNVLEKVLKILKAVAGLDEELDLFLLKVFTEPLSKIYIKSPDSGQNLHKNIDRTRLSILTFWKRILGKARPLPTERRLLIIRSITACCLQPTSHSSTKKDPFVSKDNSLRDQLIEKKYRLMFWLNGERYGTTEKLSFIDKSKMAVLVVEYLNIAHATTSEDIKILMDRFRLWGFDCSCPLYYELLKMCESHPAFHFVWVAFWLPGESPRSKRYHKLLSRWTRTIVKGCGGSVVHFLSSCMEWVLSQFSEHGLQGEIKEAVGREYFKRKNDEDMKAVMSRTDFVTLDAIFAEYETQSEGCDQRRPTISFSQKNCSPSAIRYLLNSPIDLFTHFEAKADYLGFDYLYNAQIIRKVFFTQATESSPYQIKTSESQISLDAGHDIRPYLIGLASLTLGRHRCTYLNSHFQTSNKSSKRLQYDTRFSMINQIALAKRVCSSTEFCCLFMVPHGNRQTIKIVSANSKKVLVQFDLPSTLFTKEARSCVQLVQRNNDRLIIFLSREHKVFHVVSILKRRLIGKIDLPQTHFTGQNSIYFSGDLLIISSQSSFHVYQWHLGSSEEKVEYLWEVNNLIEKKCWWNRSVVLYEETIMMHLKDDTFLAYSSGSTTGMQVFSVRDRKNRFVRVFDQPSTFDTVSLGKDGIIRYYSQPTAKGEITMGEIPLEYLLSNSTAN